ncbi:MAG: hypothetical protein KFH87_06240, partial [Bacteroidetes bacterium]|nr:hypothetical protein [Bacteroidota bacterium]
MIIAAVFARSGRENAVLRKQYRVNINRILQNAAGLLPRGIAPAALIISFIFFATGLRAQPTFDIGDSEIAIWNVSGTQIQVGFEASGLIFDEDLAL